MLGVVIGRFQVENLHEGHRYLINEAFRSHKRVIILVGCAPIQGTKHDPLDFQTRERMLRAAYPDATILPVFDNLSDEVWSHNIDQAIRGIVPNVHACRLYGGRDSFKPHYHGAFDAVEVDSGVRYQSGSGQREDIAKVVRSSPDFRAGIIYSTQNAWPYVKACVDIACVNFVDAEGRPLEQPLVLLGRKKNEQKWRLPGGMVNRGETLEQAAAREFHEETKLVAEIDQLRYLGSFPVADWRFKNAGEIGLLTALFVVQRLWGTPQASDDLEACRWTQLNGATEQVIRGHRPLIEAVIKGARQC
jgi:bifunctional NMN adenylyltransferase/nudix hydrolase